MPPLFCERSEQYRTMVRLRGWGEFLAATPNVRENLLNPLNPCSIYQRKSAKFFK